MTKSFFRVASIILALCLLTINISFAEESQAEGENSIDLEYLESIMSMIKDKYKGQITDKELIEGALNGMFDTMDKYTDYLNNEEADSFLSDVGGSYAGIGVKIAADTEYVCIVEVFESSPAAGAGIVRGDIILKVDGQSTVGKSSEEVAQLVRGATGTKVTLELRREGQTDLISVEVKRAEIRISPVTYYIKDNIGYIKLDMFNSNALLDMVRALGEMDRENIKKLVLDLRDNPGGEVSQVVAVAKKFVPKGLITRLDFRSESLSDKEYYSDNENMKYELVVLVNEMSASASEILAGAIQDTGAGVLVGTKTYGKGKVQSLYPILTPEAFRKYESELGVKIVDAYDLVENYDIDPKEDEIMGWTKITTGEYYTPTGRMIDGTGLQPDFYVENTYSENGVDLRSIDRLAKMIKPTINERSIDVYNAEKILKFCGYEIDEPDMILDEKTFKAISIFQKENGLFSYGVLDFSTQQSLNDKLQALISQYDKQLSKALEILNKKH